MILVQDCRAFQFQKVLLSCGFSKKLRTCHLRSQQPFYQSFQRIFERDAVKMLLCTSSTLQVNPYVSISIVDNQGQHKSIQKLSACPSYISQNLYNIPCVTSKTQHQGTKVSNMLINCIYNLSRCISISQAQFSYLSLICQLTYGNEVNLG